MEDYKHPAVKYWSNQYEKLNKVMSTKQYQKLYKQYEEGKKTWEDVRLYVRKRGVDL